MLEKISYPACHYCAALHVAFSHSRHRQLRSHQMLFGLGVNFSSFMNSHAQMTDATRYTTIPVNTCPRRDIGIMISLRTGCTTKSDDDITPVHIHGFKAHSGSSLNVDTAPMTMNAGTPPLPTPPPERHRRPSATVCHGEHTAFPYRTAAFLL